MDTITVDVRFSVNRDSRCRDTDLTETARRRLIGCNYYTRNQKKRSPAKRLDLGNDRRKQ